METTGIIRVLQGYVGIMEKTMETKGIIGFCGGI